MNMLTIQEAVAGLKSDGPAITEKLQHMSGETRQAQERVEQYDQALKVLQDGIGEQQAVLLQAGQSLSQFLSECQRELEGEIQQTDEVASGLTQFVATAQAELTAQMANATQKLQDLLDQIETLPPVLQQAVTKQDEVLHESRKKVDLALGNIKSTVDKAVREYESVKTDVVRQQGVLKSHVDTLVGEVTKVQTQARVDSEMLKHNSAGVVESFQLNLQEGLQTSVSLPSEQLRAGIDSLKSMAEREIDTRLSEVVDQVLGGLLRAVDKMIEKNETMVRSLRRYIPDQITRAAENLGYVVMNLDLIIRALAEGAVNWVVDWFKKGVDFISQLTGLKLDFLKQGVEMLGNVVKGAVRLSVAPMTLARTLITNPGNIWNEAQAIITGSRTKAESLGRGVRA